MKQPTSPITLPPQPDPAVQETSFEPDSSPMLSPHLNDEESAPNYGSVPRASPTSTPPPAPARALAPDLLRGLLMAFMALDHTSLMLRSWPHATAIDGENDSAPVHEWNRPAAYVIRTLTHLCAPGFTFLLGMGVVYFGRSRTSRPPDKRWTTGQLAWHFFVRALVLTAISTIMGLAVSGGKVWFLNMVLFSLAVDYLLAGLTWMAVAKTERLLAFALLKVLPLRKKDDVTEPLLPGPQPRLHGEEEMAPDVEIIRAADISWHIHNVFLAIGAAVTIWWNIWLSPTGGRCGVDPTPRLPGSDWIKIWFYPIMDERVKSGFPPLAWMSFAVLGLLYGRIILARAWSSKAITLGNALASLGFTLVFVFARIFHVGNLSEGCLSMAEHQQGGDQYLASVKSFFYLTKYPPDVAFWAFTMAGNHLLLALFGALPPLFASKVFHVLLVYGTSALFFYIVHILMLGALSLPVIALIGREVSDPFTKQPVRGVDQLWGFFFSWGMLLAILYPLCRWYGGFKKAKGPDSIWRFF
ncbi:hypothetical protein QC764_105510 [Podospora pseudoanserina]|uniref:Heparan-alpha-glucosaminide N-acetyltransferase catalytic domain-containing protein n=1 Tax=Podospora pseudoanserina TaxID=2609844 RepID=A0ABR0ILC4_9PEZI|nr:hypothetical protein QC764_105510 [Podospora pseudoanserina]